MQLTDRAQLSVKVRGQPRVVLGTIGVGAIDAWLGHLVHLGTVQARYPSSPVQSARTDSRRGRRPRNRP